MLKWGIALRSSDKLIGSVTLFHLDFTHRRAEIGYAQGRAYWGQGYMQEALKAVLNHAFEILNLHRIEADVDRAQCRVNANVGAPGLSARRISARALAS